MATEIERKFLVDKKKWKLVDKPAGQHYQQGYLTTDPERTVRVRMTPEKSYITIKGASRGAARAEFEYEIPGADAAQLLSGMALCQVDKTRYEINVNGKRWEVDEFLGGNEGLIIAEIELKYAKQKVALPKWVSKEVTDDPRYYNLYLAQNPYQQWRPEVKEAPRSLVPEESIREIAEELQSGMVCFLHKKTFEVVSIPDGNRFPDFEIAAPEWNADIDRVEDDPDFMYVEAPDTYHSFRIMEDFVFSLPAGGIKTRLMDALKGRKPFANFNKIIHEAGAERDEWFSFRDRRWDRHLADWLNWKIKENEDM